MSSVIPTMVELSGWIDERHSKRVTVRVNPAAIAFYRASANGGTRIFFSGDGVLDVSESPEEVDLVLELGGGLEPEEVRS